MLNNTTLKDHMSTNELLLKFDLLSERSLKTNTIKLCVKIEAGCINEQTNQ